MLDRIIKQDLLSLPQKQGVIKGIIRLEAFDNTKPTLAEQLRVQQSVDEQWQIISAYLNKHSQVMSRQWLL